MTETPAHHQDRPPQKIWLTYAMMVFLTLCFTAPLALPLHLKQALLDTLGMVPAEIWQGRQLWGLLTYLPLHFEIGHMTFNLSGLAFTMAVLEHQIGWQRLARLVLIGTLSGAVLHAVLHPASVIPLHGASGALSATLLYLAIRKFKLRLSPRPWAVALTTMICALCLWALLKDPTPATLVMPMSHSAHFGGALAGLFMALRQVYATGQP